MNVQEVVLVNEQDEPIGVMEKMKAHEQGVLHRAFSVFIFNMEGKMLLQQRSRHKYHGALLWTNACCSHPGPDEPVKISAERRLQDELGFTTLLEKIFVFTYHAKVENGLTEYEYDHVFVGEYNGPLHINRLEVASYRYEDMEQIKTEIERSPGHFTSWFKIAFPKIDKWWQQQYAAR